MSVIITLPGGAQPDWNATSGESQILNKPTLGTAAEADIEDFVAAATIANYETTTQLNARDTANRNRANHTGTQLAATISDIGATISANTDVALNTSARHAAVTVTDSSEIDFTLTGQNITASLINGSIGATRLSAGVNTSLGLANSALQPSNSVLTGITQIAALRLNNVAYLVSTSKPTVRSDGSALVTGDRWYRTDDGTEWFWNGTYWLSSTLYYGINSNLTQATNITGAGTALIKSFAPFTDNCFLASIFTWHQRTNGTLDGSNSYTLDFKMQDSDGTAGASLGVSLVLNMPGSTAVSSPANIVLVNYGAQTPYVGIYADVTTTGTPGAVRLVCYPVYRLIAA